AGVGGRFELAGDEVVVRRVVPAAGRSRAYLDGRLATAVELTELGARLVDLHGQHAHQALLSTRAQRAALDAFGPVDLVSLREARAALATIDSALGGLGGDERARAREIELLRFQVGELDAAGITDVDEDGALEAEEDRLADAVAHRAAGVVAHQALSGADESDRGSASDAIATALAAIAGRTPFADMEARLRTIAAEVADVAADIRAVGETIEEDPERLDAVRARRQLLHELRRKYGATLADVLAFASDGRARLAELEQHDRRAAAVDNAGTLVFDEVDAGVGGEAALAVGRALAALAGPGRHQVLVVTHLPQVAAFADAQITVTKDERDGRTVADAHPLDGDDRVVELSRMLSGQPGSATARDHAE